MQPRSRCGTPSGKAAPNRYYMLVSFTKPEGKAPLEKSVSHRDAPVAAANSARSAREPEAG